MPETRLSPEAFGTLLAMKRVGKIKFFEDSVAEELMGTGFAELKGKALVITREGRQARRRARATQKAAIRKHTA